MSLSEPPSTATKELGMTLIPNRATEAVLIPLGHLRANAAFQPRVDGLKESHVRLLMASDPATWPPLLVTPNADGTFDIIEGFHRKEAGTRLGLAALPCLVDPTAGYPEAVAANLAHGLPLSLPDRKAFAQWLAEEDPDLSLREIGRRCGLHHETVKRALEEAEPTGGQNRQAPPDPIARLVGNVERTYHMGSGRSMFGFGKAGSPAPFRKAIDAYADEDRPAVAQALEAFGRACLEAAQPYLEDGGRA